MPKLSAAKLGFLWELSGKFGSKIVTIIVFAILARLLDPIEFGVLAVARIVIEYADYAAAQGLGYTLIQMKEVKDDHKNTAFTMNVLVAAFLALVIYFGAGFFASLLNAPQASSVIEVLAVSFLIASASRIQIAMLTKQMRFDVIAKAQLIIAVITGIVAISMAFQGFGVWSLVAAQFLTSILLTLFIWIVSEWKPRFHIDMASLKELYSFAWKVFLNINLNFANLKLGSVVIAVVLGPTALGFYDVARRLIDATLPMVFGALERVAFAEFSRIQDTTKEILSKLTNSIHYAALGIFPFVFGGALVSPSAIRFMFGEGWEPSVFPFAIILMSSFALLGKHLFSPVYYALGQPLYDTWLILIRVGLQVGLLLLLGGYGLDGVAMAVALAEVIYIFVAGVFLPGLLGCRYRDIYWPLIRGALYSVPMLLVAGAIYWGARLGWFDLPIPDFFIMCLAAGVGAVVYGATLYVLRVPLPIKLR